MPKKPRNTSSRIAKQKRQAKARRARKADREVAGWVAALRLDAFPVLHGGEVKVLAAERIRAHFEAELAADGEPPLDGDGEFRSLLADEVRHGALRLRPDGFWESDVDYFAPAVPSQRSTHGAVHETKPALPAPPSLDGLYPPNCHRERWEEYQYSGDERPNEEDEWCPRWRTGQCPVCEDSRADFDLIRAASVEQRRRFDDRAVHPFAAGKRTLHRSSCRHVEQSVGGVATEEHSDLLNEDLPWFAHRGSANSGWAAGMLVMTDAEAVAWVRERVGPRGGAKYQLCRICQPSLP